jgi:hypothetical protein
MKAANAKPGVWYLISSSYFVLNLLCLLVYPLCRATFMESKAYGLFAQSFFGHDREAQIISLLALYTCLKLY